MRINKVKYLNKKLAFCQKKVYRKSNCRLFINYLNPNVMSKGPFNARVKEIRASKKHIFLTVEPLELSDVHLWQEQSSPEELEIIALPRNVDVNWLNPDDVITYYRAEKKSESNDDEPNGAVVVAFNRTPDGTSLPEEGKRFFWVRGGELLAEINDVPRVVEILCGLSDYYGKRRDVLEMTIEILNCTQDPEAIDALFSIRKEVLNQLLGNNESSVAVQVADSLMTLLLSGADLEHPSRRDLRQFLSLAVMHGTPQADVDAFIASYESE